MKKLWIYLLLLFPMTGSCTPAEMAPEIYGKTICIDSSTKVKIRVKTNGDPKYYEFDQLAVGYTDGTGEEILYSRITVKIENDYMLLEYTKKAGHSKEIKGGSVLLTDWKNRKDELYRFSTKPQKTI